MRTFCTIITSNYLPYAITLHNSLKRIKGHETLHILIADTQNPKVSKEDHPGIHLIYCNELYTKPFADRIFEKYQNQKEDYLRWALKPVLLRYLLDKGFEKVIYTDCDICFFSNYDFLFDSLNNHGVLLSPSRTTSDPFLHEDEFLSGYKYGQFNGGFIGVTNRGIQMLDWWANCCIYKMEINFEAGLFVDQKYLDAAPVLFSNVGIVEHRGCNIAFWNQHECKRIRKGNQTFINGTYPIVFIHFTNKYIPELLEGNDSDIYPYYLEYQNIFSKTGHSLKEFIPNMPEYKEPGPIQKLKRKVMLRTRFKRWLYRLSKSI